MGVEHQILTAQYSCTAAEFKADNADGKRDCKLSLPVTELALSPGTIEGLDEV